MARSSTAPADAHSVSRNDETDRRDGARYDLGDEQLAHTKRILDLQIEGSRNIYTDAMRLFLVDVVVLAGLLAAGLVASSFGGMAVNAAAPVSVALLGFGTFALFVSMTYSLRAYLGDVVEYAKPVTDGGDFVDESLSRNVETIKRNAGVMEGKVDAIRTSLLTLAGGLGSLVLALGFQVVPLAAWGQIVVSLGGLVVIGYLVANVMEMEYLQTHEDRLHR